MDQKTGTIRLAGLFPNPGNTLRPGQYGRVRAVTSIRNGALVIPQRAVTELQGGYRVAVVGDDNKVSIRPVKVGDRTGSLWVIEDGLKRVKESWRRHPEGQAGCGGQPEAVCAAGKVTITK